MHVFAVRTEQPMSQHRGSRRVLVSARLSRFSAVLQTGMHRQLRVSVDAGLREQEVHGSVLGLVRLEREMRSDQPFTDLQLSAWADWRSV